jgi:hypothetical protein
MRIAEVVGAEGVGWGFNGLVWLWKSVEKGSIGQTLEVSD